MNDPGMVHGAHVAFQRQATAFSTVANIYAPYYRQADAAARAAMPQPEQVATVAGGPTHDGIAAFDYYLRHYNHGRPFILVGHSLGSDTGVIISWNTEATTVDGTNPVLLPGGLVINPITWTRTQAVATAAQNLGSIELNVATGGTPVLDENGKIKRVMGLADARVDKARGVLICSTVDPAIPPYYTPGGFPMGVYHPFDYPFYFFDVRANAADRVEHFFAGK